jgi:hypothetical protein
MNGKAADITVYATRIGYRHSFVRLFIDRRLHGVEGREGYESLRVVDGSAGETFTWQRSNLFEADHDRAGIDLNDGAAQLLMDRLWECGLRPTEGSGSAGSLSATQKHLEDMRTLVFNGPKL